jgi:hypothetical protein
MSPLSPLSNLVPHPIPPNLTTASRTPWKNRFPLTNPQPRLRSLRSRLIPS